jgi:hypothetical protein
LVKRIECDICGKRILGYSYLKGHYKTVHNKELVDESSQM